VVWWRKKAGLRVFSCRNIAAEPTEHFVCRRRITPPPKTGER
jgi:hypothetical protein